MRGSLCGYVVRGADERPVENAVVEAVADHTMEPRTACTNRAGWFTLDGLAPGHWLLHAWAPDNEAGEASAPVYGNAFSSVTIITGGGSGDEDAPGRDSVFKAWVMRMQHGSVDGRVVRAGTGEPVADATITVVRAAGPAPDIAPLTNDDGRFRLDGLPPGEWTLRAFGADGGTGEASVRVLAGQVASLTIQLHV